MGQVFWKFLLAFWGALILAGTLTEIMRSNPDVARSGSYAGDCESELLAEWALQLQAATGTTACPGIFHRTFATSGG